MKQLVAVYGSLKQGFGNHDNYLNNDDSKFLGVEITQPKYTMYGLGRFPGVVKGGETPISLEVYEVNDEVRESLDFLEGWRGEGEANFYRPIEIETKFGKANMYVLDRPDKYRTYPVIESGVWTEDWKINL